MNTIVVIATVVQTIATVVVAIATVVYTQATLRILGVQIAPSLALELLKEGDSYRIQVQNGARCKIEQLSIVVSVGFHKEQDIYPVRKCILSDEWRTLGIRESLQSQLFRMDDVDESELESGFVFDPSSVRAEYSFIRSSDARRFSFVQSISVIKNHDGRLFYYIVDDPKPIPSMKNIIVQRIQRRQEPNDL
jgi:hypothetical protein